MRALAKLPKDRFPTADDFARELEKVAPSAERRADALAHLLDGGGVRSGAAATPPPQARPGWSPGRAPDPVGAATAKAVAVVYRPGSRGRAQRAAPTVRSGSPPPPETTSRDSGPRASAHAPAGQKAGRAPPPPPYAARATSSSPSGTRERSNARSARTPASDGCHVRGSVLRAIDQAVLARVGPTIRNAVVDGMPKSYADDFRHRSLTSLVLYDLAVFEAYAAAATRLAFANDLTRWRQVGRDSVEGELSTLVRPHPRGSSGPGMIRRCIGVWSRLLDFTSWSVHEQQPTQLLLRIAGIGPAPLALRQWLIGVVEQCLRAAGFDGTSVRTRVGEAARTPELELEIQFGR